MQECDVCNSLVRKDIKLVALIESGSYGAKLEKHYG